ncbi:ABC transporter ATP-binding protein [Vineibacter terrae]|uniref:ABC transporter ATP-binding protein n=1 Tax=Vineibacter terrae TaxID=2586908 RepID=A0A5C8P9R5_9HYPH|nr:ABC transporter ATP-binding protein [Vineibacter terrae]TXL69720.1 ABC transporter ATP-binding protein [Vineibacter terrae]
MRCVAARTRRGTHVASLLEVRNISKRFGGVVAVEDLNFVIRKGEILGLIGPNGAGKTTVFNMISGIQRPTTGTITLEGQNLVGLRPDQIARKGVARTFQSSSFLPGMSVYENVYLAAAFRSLAAIQRRAAPDVTEAALRATGLVDVAERPAELLNVSQHKRLEIARAVATEPVLLMTDEIVAGLNNAETDEVLDILVRLNGTGITLVFVEHDVRAVLSVSQRLIVLAQGRCMAEGDPHEVARSPEVIKVYLGRRYAQNQ